MKIIILLTLLLCLAGLCQGCVVVPIPASGNTVTAGKRINKGETDFVKLNQTTRAEITNKFGPPFASLGAPTAIAYSWSVNSWNYFAVWPAPELIDYGSLADRTEALMFQFGLDDRVQRFGFKRLSGDRSVKDALCQWIETKTSN